MPDTATPNVEIAGVTDFRAPAVPWSTDATGGAALAEFGGRACYQSWSKPNPRTATNDGYIRHILEIGHLSVLEHGTASLYLTGVSRALTHELIRHRHLSPSQLSQRYVPEAEAAMVVPDVIAADEELAELFDDAAGYALDAYATILDRLTAKYGANSTSAKKIARQAARAILPNATETRILLTGNYRAWRHMINLRASPAADREIRAVAVAILRALQACPGSAPVFADYDIVAHHDHPDAPITEVAVSNVNDE